MSDWKSKLASKFKGNKEYEVLGNDDGINVESYKKTSDEFGEPIPTAPKTEPIKRRPMQNGGVGNGRIPKDDPNKQQISVATSSKRPTSNTTRNSRTPVENGRRVSRNDLTLSRKCLNIKVMSVDILIRKNIIS